MSLLSKAQRLARVRRRLEAARKRIEVQKRGLEAAKVALTDAEAMLAVALAQEKEALERLAAIEAEPPPRAPRPRPARAVAPPPARPPDPVLKDRSIPIVWRIAIMLLHDPVLDYQSTAEALWGPLDHRTAKNRVNAHVTQLRRMGVAKTLGGNRFEIDREQLAAHKRGRLCVALDCGGGRV